MLDIWATVKLGDTHAVAAELTALQPLFFACYSLAPILNEHALLTTMGVQIIFLWRVKC